MNFADLPPEMQEMFGHPSDLKSTNRTQASTDRLKKRQKAAFVPRRCEVEGCTVSEQSELSACSRCKCVFYCSQEHQMQDWDRHKKECKHLKKSGLHALHYNNAEEEAKYPIGCFPLEDVDLATAQCFQCGAGADEVNLGYTQCCNAVVCDNEHEYQMMSYSRNHCIRNHARYTTCASHDNEGHDADDWRTCVECENSDSQPVNTRSWYTTNGFNITPASETSFKKGSMLTYKCEKSSCKTRILPGHETETGEHMCMPCTNIPGCF